MSTLAVVLAAGGSRRFTAPDGASKLLVPFGATTLVRHCIEVAVAADLDEVAVVQGAVPLGTEVPAGVALVANPDWESGISTSLQAAVEFARGRGHAAIVVGLADQPGVVPSAWRAVAAAPASPPIAVAVYPSGPANPVRLPREVWDLLPASGDEGARVVMRARPELVQEVVCEGDPRDIDTVADLEGWTGPV